MKLACDDHGDGPVVVLLHGFPLDRSMWAAQLADLADSYRVLVPDLAGFGESAAPAAGVLSIDGMADDVVELLDAKGIAGPVVVGGLSMGGYIALSLAVRHPGRLRGLLLINTRAAADSPEGAAQRLANAGALEAGGPTAPIIDGMKPKLFGASSLQTRPELVPPIEAMMRRVPAATMAGALRGMAARADRTGELPGIAVPTLVIAGTEDRIIPIAEAASFSRRLPYGEFEPIDGAGHLTPIEAPDRVNARIRRFLASLD